MAWHEPNNKDDKSSKDPWSGEKKSEGPPDLDEAFRRLQDKLSGVFGGKKGGSDSEPGSDQGGGNIAFGFIALIALAVWFLAGVYIVGPGDQSVIMRFGKYSKTVGPGMHWMPRFVDSRRTVNVQKVSYFEYSDEMLNKGDKIKEQAPQGLQLSGSEAVLDKDSNNISIKGENIVAVKVKIQYRIAKPEDYFFQVTKPIESLQQATASALRQVTGRTHFDELLTTGREKARRDVTVLLNAILEPYRTGIEIIDVTFQDIRAPAQVKDAFDDAIKAQEDEKRYIREAKAYRADVLPKARGQASRILQEGQAYKEQIVLQAQGDVQRFNKLLPEFNRAPQVTRERLYLDALGSVLENSSKIVIDSKSSNLLYLPLDKIINAPKTTANTPLMTEKQVVNVEPTRVDTDLYRYRGRVGRDSYRGRGG